MTESKVLLSVVEYREILNSITATYIDALEGFKLLNSSIQKEIDQHGASTSIHYGEPPSTPKRNVLVSTNLGERLSHQKDNREFIGNMSLVTIYGYWEDRYREKIAAALNKKKNDLSCEIFGDIRLLRRYPFVEEISVC